MGMAVRVAILLSFLFVLIVDFGFPLPAKAYDLATFKPSPTAIKLSSPLDEKCTTAEVGAIPIRVFSDGPSILYVDRQQINYSGRPTCDYPIQIEDGPEATSPVLWASDVFGEGQTFLNGYWHPYELEYEDLTYLDQVRLVAAPKNEMILYRVGCGTDGCGSSLTVYYFRDVFPKTAVNLLSLNDNGLMTYSSRNGVLIVNGCMSPPGDGYVPGLCQLKKTVSLAFETDINKMAIQNPNPDNEMFFAYLTAQR
jgi:hypothetical protein